MPAVRTLLFDGHLALIPWFNKPPVVRAVDEDLMSVALRPRERLFIDNKAIHGRSSCKARFDGADLWLKPINVARDLHIFRCPSWRASPLVGTASAV